MSVNDNWYDYFQWLNKIIDSIDLDLHIYHNLLWQLHNTEFKAILKNDNNRIDDAIDLRIEFGHLMKDYPIGILEVMVALANRAEKTIMRDDFAGDRTSKWFWEMVNSLSLSDFTDNYYDSKKVNDILNRFINRKYEPNGAGGLFIVRPPHTDMRKIEIWDQLCLYLDDVLADEGIIGIR